MKSNNCYYLFLCQKELYSDPVVQISKQDKVCGTCDHFCTGHDRKYVHGG